MDDRISKVALMKIKKRKESKLTVKEEEEGIGIEEMDPSYTLI